MNQRISFGSIAAKVGTARSIFGLAILSAVGVLGLAASPAAAQQTTSQATDEQLNQLFLFQTTPDKSATGEAYVTGEFRFLKYPGSVKTYLFQVQGQYSFTDQIAAGAIIPVENVKFDSGSHTGFADITLYGQYKLDQLVSHDVVDLTGELDVDLPTGSESHGLGTGHLGVRPEILAYKGFEAGPGILGLYGSMGVTITTNSDFRLGIAGTYDYEKVVGILEFTDIAGNHGKPFVDISPGVAYQGLNPWEFAIGFPFGINDGSPDWGVVLKVTYAFQR